MPRVARPWFRVYSEALDNPKLQRLAPAMFKAWFNLACLANVNELRGFLPYIKDVAFRLRMREAQAQEAIDHLVTAGLVEWDAAVGRYHMHDWDEWQFDSDANLTPGRRAKYGESPRYDGDNAAQIRSDKDKEKNRYRIREEQNVLYAVEHAVKA